ncbi:transcriptional regulator [Enterobacter kobei]|uniref:transcriptional regulator n=1 Tax=Enterobacter kobei TaxID=208224 RepID=UPI000B7057C3|nr:transcriptional regulator [Enterobacter kobei]OUF18711.1 hypothetical protein AZ039_004649 [Enterobacter kobei]
MKESNTIRHPGLIVLTDNSWLQEGIAMLMPEANCCRMTFESRTIPAELDNFCRVVIAVDCRIFIRGEWTAFEELHARRKNATVVWLTRPETGLVLPRERRCERRVDQLMDIRPMRKILSDVLNGRPDKNGGPLLALTRTEQKFLPFFLAGISIDTLSRVTGLAEKTLHTYRRRILVKNGLRAWCYFQHIHQRNPDMLGISSPRKFKC